MPRLALHGKARLPEPSLPEGTRRRILETALHLFATRGFAATSIRDVTSALELQPSAVYAHFRAKEQILAEIVHLGHAAHEAALVEATSRAPDDPASQLRVLARVHALMHVMHPHIAVVVNEELYSLPDDLAAPALAIRSRMSVRLLDILRRGAADGTFSIADPLAVGAAIAATSMRIPYWYAPGSAMTPDALADLYGEIALRIAGATEARP